MLILCADRIVGRSFTSSHDTVAGDVFGSSGVGFRIPNSSPARAIPGIVDFAVILHVRPYLRVIEDLVSESDTSYIVYTPSASRLSFVPKKRSYISFPLRLEWLFSQLGMPTKGLLEFCRCS